MNKDILKRILKYTEKYKAHVFGSFIAAILSVTSSLIGPILIGKSIDHMIGIGAVDFRSLFKTLIILALIYAIGNLFVWLLTYLTNWISYQTVNDMRHQLFDKISTLPLKFYDTHPHGDTISHFINDIDASLRWNASWYINIAHGCSYHFRCNRIYAVYKPNYDNSSAFFCSCFFFNGTIYC
ncbi:ABC transporter transmembrane domain-containing protein [Tissierella sp. P1]|uniref:ABC transporter transmembrane domain-containing protein n=1 Tax=Tissierella sp. P1 TaxID=1280483 RepID=UPI0021011C23|nr:ABC transporter transmembrane domain-containing protein [Tissierella sp. P1]